MNLPVFLFLNKLASRMANLDVPLWAIVVHTSGLARYEITAKITEKYNTARRQTTVALGRPTIIIENAVA